MSLPPIEKRALRWMILEFRVQKQYWPSRAVFQEFFAWWPDGHVVPGLYPSWQHAIEDARKYGWKKYMERGW